MHDTGKIVGGLALFAALVTAPVWYSLASRRLWQVPELARPKEGQHCIESKEYMRAWHMDLLGSWRDAVVRTGERVYVASDGERYEMSLTGTCLRCHDDPAKFCDRCHAYSAVNPYCWDCHQRPSGK